MEIPLVQLRGRRLDGAPQVPGGTELGVGLDTTRVVLVAVALVTPVCVARTGGPAEVRIGY